MKIAVTYDNGQVFGHFGHCRQFLVAEVENGQQRSQRTGWLPARSGR